MRVLIRPCHSRAGVIQMANHGRGNCCQRQRLLSVSTKLWILRPHMESLSVCQLWSHVGTGNMISRDFSTSSRSQTGYQLKNNLEDCYRLLGVSEDCTEEEVKEAYLAKVRLYHPDTGGSTADSKKFTQLQEAYVSVKKKVEEEKGNEIERGEVELPFYDINHIAPQHRQYLEYGGVGSGTPSQRQKQYQQYRVARATDSVHEHKVERIKAENDQKALVAKDQRAARKAKIRAQYIVDYKGRRAHGDPETEVIRKCNTIERLAEDLIAEAMSKGDFDNLPGKGRPLEYKAVERNPYVDSATHKINQILLNNDYIPDWITMEKEIREDYRKTRERLAYERSLLSGPPSVIKPPRGWHSAVEQFKISIEDINCKIFDYNLIVPIMSRQMVSYNFDKEMKKIENSYMDLLPKRTEEKDIGGVRTGRVQPLGTKGEANVYTGVNGEEVRYGDVWDDIRSLFQWREIWGRFKSVFRL